jgi:hypothetical protein
VHRSNIIRLSIVGFTIKNETVWVGPKFSRSRSINAGYMNTGVRYHRRCHNIDLLLLVRHRQLCRQYVQTLG